MLKLLKEPERKVMQHFVKGENVGITLCKQFKTGDNYAHVFVSNKIIESSYVSNRTSEITSLSLSTSTLTVLVSRVLPRAQCAHPISTWRLWRR
jgi:hypothetical protein